MVRICGALKICCVALNAVGADVQIIRAVVTGLAISDVVAELQREKTVVEVGRIPVVGIRTVALRAVHRKTRRIVVRLLRRVKVLPVAVDAVIADAVKAQLGLRAVAIHARQAAVGPGQRKTVLLVKLGDVIHQPTFLRMAANTVIAHALAVHVLVA